MRLGITACLLVFALNAPALAAESSYGIGMAAGSLTGTGSSFRQSFPNGFGYGAAMGGALMQGQSGPWYDAGLIGTKMLADLQFGRLYALMGTSIYQMDPTRPSRWLVGGGLGIEMGSSDGITLALDVPLVYLSDPQLFIPIPCLSLHYNWAEPHADSLNAPDTDFFTRQGMGFAAGASGVGFSYRAWQDTGWGGSLTGIAFGDRNSTVTSLGLGVSKLLSEAEGSRFYLTSALHNLGGASGNQTMAGLGYGLEVGSRQGLVLNLDLLLCLVTNDGSLLPLPNVGLTFYY